MEWFNRCLSGESHSDYRPIIGTVPHLWDSAVSRILPNLGWAWGRPLWSAVSNTSSNAASFDWSTSVRAASSASSRFGSRERGGGD